MKPIFSLLVGLLALVLVACANPPKVPVPDAEQARAALNHLDEAVTLAANTCTVASRAIENEKKAEELVDFCVNALIPARDAVHVANEAANPWWSPSATKKIACAAKATGQSLETLCASKLVKCGDTLKDLATMAKELGTLADKSCDPAHPTTEVTMVEDWRIPRVEPNYPR